MGVTTKPFNPQAYVLNANGTKFELTNNPSYQSFRCYFVPTYGATNLPAELTINSDAMGIENVYDNVTHTSPVKVIKNGKLYIGNYNVAGQRVK